MVRAKRAVPETLRNRGAAFVLLVPEQKCNRARGLERVRRVAHPVAPVRGVRVLRGDLLGQRVAGGTRGRQGNGGNAIGVGGAVMHVLT